MRIPIFAAAVLIAAQAQASSIEDIQQASYKLYDSRPMVFPDGGEFAAHCSGQFIHSSDKGDYFLTAAHCVPGNVEGLHIRKRVLNDSLDVVREEIHYLETARYYSVSKRDDVAILRTRLPSGTFRTVDIATDEEFRNHVSFGSRVYTTAFPMTFDMTWTEGSFGGLVKSPFDDNGFLNRATPGIQSGSSGGGLYAKVGDEYKLIGTVTGKFRGTDFMNFFSTTKAVNEIVTRVYRVEKILTALEKAREERGVK